MAGTYRKSRVVDPDRASLIDPLSVSTLIILVLSIQQVSSRVTTYTLDVAETMMGTIIYDDGTVEYNVVPPGVTTCDIGKEITFFRKADGSCYDMHSFDLPYQSVNYFKNTTFGANGKEVTIVQKGYFNLYPAGHRSGLPFAVALGSPSSEAPVVTQGTLVEVTSGPHIKLYRADANTEARIAHSYFIHSATGKVSKEIDTTVVAYYYVATGVGKTFLEVGVDLPDDEIRYLKTAPTTVPRVPIGITHETAIRLAVPYEKASQTRRRRRQAATILATTTQVMVSLHGNSVRAAIAVIDQTDASQTNTINKQLELQSEIIQREKGIQKLDLKILEQEAVNSHKHRGLLTMAKAIRDRIDGVTGYLLQLPTVVVSNDVVNALLKEKYRTEINNKTGGKILNDYISGGKYYAVVREEGSLASGRNPPSCNTSTCLVSGNYRHYRGFNDVREVNGPVLNTLTCGVYVSGDINARHLGSLEARSNTQKAIEYLQTLNYNYFYVTDVDCHSSVIEYSTAKLNQLSEKANQLLGTPRIESISDGFKLQCPAEPQTNTSFEETARSYLCETEKSIDDLDSALITLDNLKLVHTSALDAYDRASVMTAGNFLSTLTGVGARAAADFFNNFEKYNVKKSDVEYAELLMKIGLGLATTSLILNVVLIGAFLYLRSRMKKKLSRLEYRAHSPPDMGMSEKDLTT